MVSFQKLHFQGNLQIRILKQDMQHCTHPLQHKNRNWIDQVARNPEMPPSIVYSRTRALVEICVANALTIRLWHTAS